MPAPKAPLAEQINPAILKRWIIWDPIPDYVDLRPEVLRQIWAISLEIEKEHLAVEQKKLDMVRELILK
jgi:hypothetical protein